MGLLVRLKKYAKGPSVKAEWSTGPVANGCSAPHGRMALPLQPLLLLLQPTTHSMDKKKQLLVKIKLGCKCK